jgi:hypothetical protein
LFIIGIKYIVNSNVLEMIRKMELVKVGDELYEIVKKLPIQRFTKEVAGESADTLKQYYLFVNKIEDLEIIS